MFDDSRLPQIKTAKNKGVEDEILKLLKKNQII
jgi:hypothetical protein